MNDIMATYIAENHAKLCLYLVINSILGNICTYIPQIKIKFIFIILAAAHTDLAIMDLFNEFVHTTHTHAGPVET